MTTPNSLSPGTPPHDPALNALIAQRRSFASPVTPEDRARIALAPPRGPSAPQPYYDAPVDTDELNRLIIEMATGKPRVLPENPALAAYIKAIWAEDDAHPERRYEINPP